MSDRLWNITGARNYPVVAPGDITDAHSDMFDRLSDLVVPLRDMIGALLFPSDRLRDSADQHGMYVVHVRSISGEVKTSVAYVRRSVDHIRKRSGDVRALVAQVK